MIDVITRINMSDFDLNLVTASISPSIQDVRELHALSPPRYALDRTSYGHAHLLKFKVHFKGKASAVQWE